jgi:hypothetical protein
MENLLEQGGEFLEDLLFQVVGEPLPDAPGGSLHVPSHSFARASSSSNAALVNVVRNWRPVSALRLVAGTGMRRRMKPR